MQDFSEIETEPNLSVFIQVLNSVFHSSLKQNGLQKILSYAGQERAKYVKSLKSCFHFVLLF